jgi:transcription initiation factor TFIIH subunit 2
MSMSKKRQNAWVDANASTDPSSIGVLAGDDEDQDGEYRAKRALLSTSHSLLPVYRSLLRSLYIVLDCSMSLSTGPSSHLPPTKHSCVVRSLMSFVASFFSTNPTSTVGIITLQSGSAKLLLPLTPGPGTTHLAMLNDLLSKPRQYIDGMASVGKGMDVALQSLLNVPRGCSREILCVYNSIATQDAEPTRLLALPGELVKAAVTVTTISTEPEIYALRNLTVLSGGSCHTVLSKDHLKALLDKQTPPPPKLDHDKTTLHKTAFPTLVRTPHPHLATCNGRAANEEEAALVMQSYECPVCKTANVACPGTCGTCGVRMSRSVDNVRCARNLYPVALFVEVPVATETVCFGCANSVKPGKRVQMCMCEKCEQIYCYQCDQYVHEDLRCCPGCLAKGL